MEIKTADDPQIEIEQLKTRKAALALEVVSGNENARVELTDVNVAIAGLEQELELRELAAAEQLRRDDEAAEQRRDAERQQKQQELSKKRNDYHAVLRDLQARFQALVAPIQSASELDREIWRLANDLGIAYRIAHKREIASRLKIAISGLLWPEIEGERPARIPATFNYCEKCGGAKPDIPNVVHNCSSIPGSTAGLTSSEEFVRFSADGNHAVVVSKGEEIQGEGIPNRLPGESDEEREARLTAKLRELNAEADETGDIAA